ncbi:MAG: rod shape-determining protein MreD [Lachnospiraceae bacterium]|nr:rod shape-determining protein MreD [Lachnospiraceae bacterium]MBQ7864006.1 rod shape-determining protein MreD [Lachnospiraceae bacterium]
MVRLIVTLLELIFCFLLQTSLFSFIRISGVVPNCLLILVITIAYTKGQISAMVTGFFAGILLDLCFSETVGFCAILYMIVAFLAGFSNKIYYERDYFVPGALILAGELVYSFMYYILFFLLRGKLELHTYFIYTILPRMLYTILVSLALYPAFHGIHRLLLRLEGKNDD